MIRTFVLEHSACPEAVAWVERQDGASDYNLWRSCPNGEWLLWLAGQAGVEHTRLVLAACDCARTALPFVPAREDRPRRAIEAAEAWAVNPCEGTARAAWLASGAAEAASGAASGAAEAAAWAAARAAAAAAWAAAGAADGAAEAAAGAAEAAAWAAAGASLVRRRIPWRVVRDALRRVA